MKMTGAQILVKSLEAEGVDCVFGLPGGAILPTFDALYDSKIKFHLVRHEQGASHMADAYGRACGKPGVCIVTSGPAATNTITGLARRIWIPRRWFALPVRLHRLRSAVTLSKKRMWSVFHVRLQNTII